MTTCADTTPHPRLKTITQYFTKSVYRPDLSAGLIAGLIYVLTQLTRPGCYT